MEGESAVLGIPLGYRFLPTDEELVTYLFNKIMGNPLPSNAAILNECIDLYGNKDPAEIFGATSPGVFDVCQKLVVYYAYTRLNKKSENRIHRTVQGKGTWKGVNSVQVYESCSGGGGGSGKKKVIIGAKKNFIYLNTINVKTGWNMTEYSIAGDKLRHALRQGKDTDCVLCIVKTKHQKKANPSGGEEITHQEDAQENNAVSGSTDGGYQMEQLHTVNYLHRVSEKRKQHHDDDAAAMQSERDDVKRKRMQESSRVIGSTAEGYASTSSACCSAGALGLQHNTYFGKGVELTLAPPFNTPKPEQQTLDSDEIPCGHGHNIPKDDK